MTKTKNLNDFYKLFMENHDYISAIRSKREVYNNFDEFVENNFSIILKKEKEDKNLSNLALQTNLFSGKNVPSIETIGRWIKNPDMRANNIKSLMEYFKKIPAANELWEILKVLNNYSKSKAPVDADYEKAKKLIRYEKVESLLSQVLTELNKYPFMLIDTLSATQKNKPIIQKKKKQNHLNHNDFNEINNELSLSDNEKLSYTEVEKLKQFKIIFDKYIQQHIDLAEYREDVPDNSEYIDF